MLLLSRFRDRSSGSTLPRAGRSRQPVQISVEDRQLLLQMASRTDIPARVLVAVAVHSLAGLGRKEIANFVRLYFDLPVCVRASEVEI